MIAESDLLATNELVPGHLYRQSGYSPKASLMLITIFNFRNV